MAFVREACQVGGDGTVSLFAHANDLPPHQDRYISTFFAYAGVAPYASPDVENTASAVSGFDGSNAIETGGRRLGVLGRPRPTPAGPRRQASLGRLGTSRDDGHLFRLRRCRGRHRVCLVRRRVPPNWPRRRTPADRAREGSRLVAPRPSPRSSWCCPPRRRSRRTEAQEECQLEPLFSTAGPT